MSILTFVEREYLHKSITDLLKEYNYEYTHDAVDTIISTWEENKQSLIEAFKKHPNYLEGKFMIAFDHNYDRKIDTDASTKFSSWLLNINGPMATLVDALPEEIQQKRKEDECTYLPMDIFVFFEELKCIAARVISKETAERINEFAPAVHAHEGQKTSRVINKLCTYLGYHKHADYNREFAKYADSLSPLTIKRHTILSINPLDYLTMSFGNSWASCHTIDKENKRGMPNDYSGCYSSGTISYMLDSTSMVFYTVDADYNGNEYWNEPKINRQMFHWGQEKLIQSRLYPQDNDGCDEVYAPYRNIVQDIISKIFDFPNLWSLTKGISAAGRYIDSKGTHYRDYHNFNNCSLSRIKGSENEFFITVGHAPICVECGESHSNAECINCCSYGERKCSCCGCYVDDYDVRWVDGDPYCEDCASYCDCCDEYHTGESTYVYNRHGWGIYVCECCRDEYYRYCESCGEYVHEDNARWIESEDAYVCNSCFEDEYFTCPECGEYFHEDNGYMHDGTYYCEDCYEEITEEEENEEENEQAEAC